MMKNRMTINTMGVLCFTAVLIWNLSVSLAQKPNILFIAVDDLNDHIGHLGGYPGVIPPTWIGWRRWERRLPMHTAPHRFAILPASK